MPPSRFTGSSLPQRGVHGNGPRLTMSDHAIVNRTTAKTLGIECRHRFCSAPKRWSSELLQPCVLFAALHESENGTSRTLRDVRLESGMRSKADVRAK